ncbi:MAG: peptide chain release factor subunit 1 [Blastocatellia bacterium]
MISYDDIRQLQQHPSGPDSCIFSLYVNIDQSNAVNLNRGFITQVENLFRRMAEDKNNHHRERFDAECKRALAFLGDYSAKGKGLVIFSDSKQDFWWQRDLQVEVPTAVRWSPMPWVRPLLELLEDHDSFAVVLTDKQRARVLTVDATGMAQHAEILSDVPNKHATTGTDHIMSQTQMQRDHTEHVKAHTHRVIDELTTILDRLNLSRLVIGGPVEATSVLVNELPKRLQQMIIGTIAVPLDANGERLSNELRKLQQQSEGEDEARMVESMITAAMKGDRAVLGIGDTLSAIQQQRVYRLIVTRDYHIEGKECSACHMLVVDGDAKCPFCGGGLEPAPDLINRASHRVIEQAGKVQIVSGAAADKLAGTGVGAILRF